MGCKNNYNFPKTNRLLEKTAFFVAKAVAKVVFYLI